MDENGKINATRMGLAAGISVAILWIVGAILGLAMRVGPMGDHHRDAMQGGHAGYHGALGGAGYLACGAIMVLAAGIFVWLMVTIYNRLSRG